MKSLAEMALLANVSISQWTGRSYDREVSEEIEKEHNAHDAGRYNKILIKEDGFKEIQKVARAARDFF